MADDVEFWAHTPNKRGEPQYLPAHLLGVAKRTAEQCAKFDVAELGYMAGLLHDIGKYNPEFQEYLRCCAKDPNYKRKSPLPHAVYGCYACEEEDSLDPLMPIIAGHHAGMYAPSGRLEQLMEQYRKQSRGILASASGLIAQHRKPASIAGKFSDSEFGEEVLWRFLFSCLVDADSRDTAIHSGNEPEMLPSLPDVAACADFFTNKYNLNMKNKVGPFN